MAHAPTTPPRVDPARLAAAFRARFGLTPRIARAPGRVNLIGEHTDYNGGLVLPAAIDRACYVAVARVETEPADEAIGAFAFHLAAPDLDADLRLPVIDLHQGPLWARYLAAPAAILGMTRPVPSLAIMAQGEVPMGMGMSSSAALLVAGALAVADVAGVKLTPFEVATLAQRGEREIVGTPCGLMDQFASTHGARGCAVLLDCASFEWRTVPAPSTAAIVVFESGVRHKLAEGGYAKRRSECARAARATGVMLLCEADAAALPDLAKDPVLQRRARHVWSETARVREAVAALEGGDLRTLGALMTASHASLRDDFEVTCAETDALADLAQSTPGVYGARQMGGGFGGGVIALVAADAVDDVIAKVTARTGLPAVVCTPSDGAEILA
ncbi:MAG: galactokinase [Alphaproteobacteria bacterium]|nr:galactokinase [Alphaproteobacteria bacterium]